MNKPLALYDLVILAQVLRR